MNWITGVYGQQSGDTIHITIQRERYDIFTLYHDCMNKTLYCDFLKLNLTVENLSRRSNNSNLFYPVKHPVLSLDLH